MGKSFNSTTLRCRDGGQPFSLPVPIPCWQGHSEPCRAFAEHAGDGAGSEGKRRGHLIGFRVDADERFVAADGHPDAAESGGESGANALADFDGDDNLVGLRVEATQTASLVITCQSGAGDGEDGGGSVCSERRPSDARLDRPGGLSYLVGD